MVRVDVPIRSPTGTAWLATVLFAIATGEIFREIDKTGVARFFNTPYLDEELWPAFGIAAFLLVGSLVWLISLYARPGSLILDEAGGKIRRVKRWLWQNRSYDAPLGDWKVALTFFSEGDRARDTFKRIELVGPDHREVLLYGDVRDREGLLRGLEALASQLGAYEIELQQSPDAPTDAATDPPLEDDEPTDA